MNLFKQLFKKAQRAYLRYTITEERPDLIGLPFVQQLRRYAMDAINDYVRSETLTELPPLVQQALAYESEDGSRSFWLMHYHIANTRLSVIREECDELTAKYEAASAAQKIEHDEALKLLKETIDLLTQIRNPANSLN